MGLHQPAPNSSGATENRISFKQMYLALWKRTKVQPDELKSHPALPPHFPYIWEWFTEFPNDITWQEIKAWSDISGIVPTRWESSLLISLDRLK